MFDPNMPTNEALVFPTLLQNILSRVGELTENLTELVVQFNNPPKITHENYLRMMGILTSLNCMVENFEVADELIQRMDNMNIDIRDKNFMEEFFNGTNLS